MGTERHRCLAVFAGLVALLFFAACGGEDPQDPDNQQQNQQQVGCHTDADCEGDTPYCFPPTGECLEQNWCEEHEHCEGNEEPYCDPDTNLCTDQSPAACQTDDDCTGAADFCHDGNCVTDDFICQLKGCGGQRGVCDPSAGADGDCVNADTCHTLGECVEDYKCIENDCIPVEQTACADCTEQEECVHDAETLTVECVSDLVCEPEARECEDDEFLLICNEDGTAEQTIHCDLGCIDDDGPPRCEEPDGDTCQQPFTVDEGETSDTWQFVWSDYSNNLDPGPATGCVDQDTDLRTSGSDVAFGAELEPGEVAVVEVITTLDYAVIYMLDQCSDSVGSCVAPDGELSEEHDDGWMRAAWYENSGSDTETVHFVADTGIGASNQLATANLYVSEQVCEPGGDACEEGLLGECSTYGTHFETDPDRECTHGCISDDPGDALCEPEPHTECTDAQQYGGEQLETFSGEIIDFHADVTLDTAGCLQQSVHSSNADTLEGPSAYYAVDLDNGERLNANLASEFEAGLWFADSCGTDDCLKAVNQSSTAEHAEFVADGDQTVYVVVQAASADVPHGEFTVDLSIDPPLCQDADPGDILGCVDGDSIHFCHGTAYPDRYQCESDCENGACVEPSGRRCLDPIPLHSGDSDTGSFDAQSGSLTPLTCGGRHDFHNPIGSETIYELDLEADDLVDVSLNTISPDAGVYLLDECPVATEDVSDQCIDGAIPTQHIEFFVDTAGTYYLVVDTGDRFDPASYTLDVDINAGVCLPETRHCDEDTIQQCNSEGTAHETVTSCLVGCDDSEESVVCTAPEAANDRCGDDDTFPVDSSGRIADDFERFDQQENLGGGEADCFDDGTSGPDAFYEFTLDEMQGVTVDASVDIDDSGSHRVGLYIAEGCATDSDVDCLETVVLEGSDVMEDTIDFYSVDGGTFTLGIAGIDDFDSGEFALDFEFFDGECDPGEDNFCDDGTAVQCTGLGQQIEAECSYGCDSGECLEKTGDSCSRPFVLEDDGDASGDSVELAVSDNIGTFSDAFNPYQDGQSCTGYYGDGPDVVVQFDAEDGDELEAVLDSEYDGALWLTTDCDDAADECVAGVDDVFGAGTEELTYTVGEDGTYLLVADAVQSGATGEFTLDVTVESQ